MTKSIKQIAEIAITRYERLLARAEAKGISVWELKAELQGLKDDLASRTTVKEEVKPVEKPKKKYDTFKERLEDTVVEDTVLPDGEKTKENEDRDLNIPQKPAGDQWLEPGGIAKEDQ
jgi:hypothetical protein